MSDMHDVIDMEKLNNVKRKALPTIKKVGVIIGTLLVVVVSWFLFTFNVNEIDQAVVVRFGEVQKIVISEKTTEVVEQIEQHSRLSGVKIVEGKGLQFKIPFIDTVETYSDRLLTYDTRPRQVTTLDKKRVELDNYAQWRITNPALFRVTMHTEVNANTRLDDMIYSNLNSEIGRTSMTQLISDIDHVEQMLVNVKERTNNGLEEYGMEVVDIRIRQTDLPEQNLENIFNRMRTERERIANRYLSEGEEEAQKIRSDADRQARIIEAEAYETAEILRGQGDAEATKIYAEVYNQDPEFYEFFRSLQAYRATLDEDTTIVIPADSYFAQFLFGNDMFRVQD
ncbi:MULTISPECIES: protease modulator HflC [Bacillaceae]|uniref:Protein HflC n=1 Tax=Evansella alkalicola TaxID=745819 RepID=A0ABS6JNA7_9BACI|nr:MULTISPECIES: protease modulator HflC [Bacillaceae]MBU9720038.1 protease modulator HflC [Bacillus alkalicola]